MLTHLFFRTFDLLLLLLVFYRLVSVIIEWLDFFLFLPTAFFFLLNIRVLCHDRLVLLVLLLLLLGGLRLLL